MQPRLWVQVADRTSRPILHRCASSFCVGMSVHHSAGFYHDTPCNSEQIKAGASCSARTALRLWPLPWPLYYGRCRHQHRAGNGVLSQAGASCIIRTGLRLWPVPGRRFTAGVVGISTGPAVALCCQRPTTPQLLTHPGGEPLSGISVFLHSSVFTVMEARSGMLPPRESTRARSPATSGSTVSAVGFRATLYRRCPMMFRPECRRIVTS